MIILDQMYMYEFVRFILYLSNDFLFVSNYRYDWLQNDWSVTIVIYSKCRDMRHENVIIRKRESVLQVNLIIDEYTYLFKMGE